MTAGAVGAGRGAANGGVFAGAGRVRSVAILVKPAKRAGNWTPEGKAERAALRRDYLELTPAQRTAQVFELSRFMSPGWQRPDIANAVPELDIQGILAELTREGVEFLGQARGEEDS